MKILLADDHVLFREGLAMMIMTIFPQSHIYQVSNWTESCQSLEHNSFDLALLDLFMPAEFSWEKSLYYFLNTQPVLPVCIVSASDNILYLQTAFKLGVKGYIHKSAEVIEIKQALISIINGKLYFPSHLSNIIHKPNQQMKQFLLTSRQREILSLLAKSYSNQLISERINLSESTVKSHIHNIFKLLEVKNRMEAVKKAQQHGLLI